MKIAKTQTLVRLLLVVLILVLVNFISVRLFGRLDLTKQKVYTLSDASKRLVGGLDDRVTVKAYFTEDLPAPYNNNRRAVLDILNDYRAYSKGNLQYDFVNPQGDKGEQDAQQQGIPPVEVQVVNNDKLEVKRGYLGLVMQYEDKKEVIPVVQNLSSLEFDITSALKRLTTRVKKRVGYSQGHDEPTLDQLRQSTQNVNKQYDMVPVDLSRGAKVPDDIDVLLVISPAKKFDDSAKYAIDQFLMRGGKAAFLLNRMNANLNSQYRFAQATDIGLDDLLAQYGVRVNADLVRDAQCANITVSQMQGPFQIQSQVPFAYLPAAANFDKTNPIVKDLQAVVFYFVSSVDTTLASSKGLQADVLIRSSKRSGRQSGFIMLDPFQRLAATDFGESGIPLAVTVQGSFKSAFVGKQPAAVLTQSPETRIVVVGDGDFMKDQFLGNKGNLTLFENIVDYLADDAGLITIRSKDVVQPPLEVVSDGTKKMLKYGDLFVPPLAVVAYGIFRWRRRVAVKRTLDTKV
ncbi:MAG TPA: Gldg family protein [Bacteroidota bacterium]|nr:Gldg family protein [Bacteroidota bacterium]